MSSKNKTPRKEDKQTSIEKYGIETADGYIKYYPEELIQAIRKDGLAVVFNFPNVGLAIYKNEQGKFVKDYEKAETSIIKDKELALTLLEYYNSGILLPKMDISLSQKEEFMEESK